MDIAAPPPPLADILVKNVLNSVTHGLASGEKKFHRQTVHLTAFEGLW